MDPLSAVLGHENNIPMYIYYYIVVHSVFLYNYVDLHTLYLEARS